MSKQTFEEAFCQIDAHYKNQILAETWGHLAPKKNKLYKGSILFAIGCYGDDPLNPTILHCEFDGLNDSPWFFDSLMEFLDKSNQVSYDKMERIQNFKVGNVYQFDGTFKNYVFKGSFHQLKLENNT